MKPSELSRVCLAISSFRNDEQVLSLLERLYELGQPFARVLVVDSLVTGRIPRELEQRGWHDVAYHAYDRNLGSAGNLSERLRLAGQSTLDWVYTINHDGNIEPERVAALVQVGTQGGARVGAVYPLRRMTERGDTFDVTGLSRVPLRAHRVKERPAAAVLDTHWSSSNGALYALGPVREGLLPWADLWMGYEDLGFGWLLEQQGYRQLLCTETLIDDGYEYGQRKGVWVTQKPSWYAYYHARNFLLVARRTEQPKAVQAAIMARLVAELPVILLFRSDKSRRLRFAVQGAVDGLLNRTGKWRFP